MVQHGLAWFSMDYHGVAWCSMVWRGSAHGDRSSVVPPMIEPEVSRINGFGWVLTTANMWSTRWAPTLRFRVYAFLESIRAPQQVGGWRLLKEKVLRHEG